MLPARGTGEGEAPGARSGAFPSAAHGRNSAPANAAGPARPGLALPGPERPRPASHGSALPGPARPHRGGACGAAAAAAQVARRQPPALLLSFLPASPGGEHRPGRLLRPLPVPVPLPSLPAPLPGAKPPAGPRGEFAPPELGEGVGESLGRPPAGAEGWALPGAGGVREPPAPSRSLARFPRPSSSSGGFFSAQLRVEPLRAAPLLRVALFLFILGLSVVFHLFGAFSRAAAPRRYCLLTGAGRGPPAAGRGWRPRSRGTSPAVPGGVPGTRTRLAPSLPPRWNTDILVGTPLQAHRHNFVSQFVARKVTADSYQEPPATRWCWCVSPLGVRGLWCHCRGVYFMRSLCCSKI